MSKARALWLLALGALLCCACAGPSAPSSDTPTPGAAPPSPTAWASPTRALPTAAPSPRPTTAPTPTPRGERNALDVTAFPYAATTGRLFPMPPAKAAAKVVNSVFFDTPPFFGFDVQTAAGWFHVTGADEWATWNGQRISPAFAPAPHPRDGDTLVVYGEAREMFVTASYVGWADGTPWYYRSLLHGDELRAGRLPAVYAGLDVWVRDVYSPTAAWAALYALPEGTHIPTEYAGRELLLGGRLEQQGGLRLRVTRGVYMQSGAHTARLVEPLPESPRETWETGVVRGVERDGRLVSLQRADGSLLELHLDEATRLEFADGSPASAAELRAGLRVEARGTATQPGHLWASRLTLVSASASGSTLAAYASGLYGDLWSVSTEPGPDLRPEALPRRQITHLDAPAAGLANAVFAPDGRQFAFARQSGTASELVLGDVQTGALRTPLGRDDWQECDPAWSPDGQRIVFCRYRLEGERRVDGGVWLLRLSDDSLKRLTSAARSGLVSMAPRWSPDGRHLAYGQANPSGERPGTLYVLSFPSDFHTTLEYAGEWRWSTDSTYLVCTRQAPDETRARLWVVQRDGSSPTWMTPAGRAECGARLSPDGSAIAFLSRPVGGARDELWIMQSDATHRVQPENAPLARRAVWTADSQAVVFLRVNSADVASGLWLVGRDGHGLRELAPDAQALVGTFREP